MPSKQHKPGRLRAVASPNLGEEDMHLAVFSGLDSSGKPTNRKEGSK